jgi:hypothetical protein
VQLRPEAVLWDPLCFEPVRILNDGGPGVAFPNGVRSDGRSTTPLKTEARESSFHGGILDQCGGGIANNTIKHDIKRVHAP